MEDELKKFVESEKSRLEQEAEENKRTFYKLVEGDNLFELIPVVPVDSKYKDQKDFQVKDVNGTDQYLSVNIHSPLYAGLINALASGHLKVNVNRKGTTRDDTRYKVIYMD